MEVVALGTSAGAPTRERNVQACYVRLEDGSFVVVDCGEGTQQRLLECGSKEFEATEVMGEHVYNKA